MEIKLNFKPIEKRQYCYGETLFGVTIHNIKDAMSAAHNYLTEECGLIYGQFLIKNQAFDWVYLSPDRKYIYAINAISRKRGKYKKEGRKHIQLYIYEFPVETLICNGISIEQKRNRIIIKRDDDWYFDYDD